MLVRVHCLLRGHGIVVGLTSSQLLLLQGYLISLGLRRRLLLGHRLLPCRRRLLGQGSRMARRSSIESRESTRPEVSNS